MTVQCPAHASGVHCVCNNGWAGEPKWDHTRGAWLHTCVDIDECASRAKDGGHRCEGELKCVNIDGSFKCQATAGAHFRLPLRLNGAPESWVTVMCAAPCRLEWHRVVPRSS